MSPRCIVPGCGAEATGLQCPAHLAGARADAAPAPEAADAPRVRTRDPHAAGVSEAETQAAVLQLLALRGWVAWRIGQRNARGTQDDGVPDLYCVHPAHGALWIEVKRPDGGVQSHAQRRFQAAVRGAGQRYICGSLNAVRDYLDHIERGKHHG